MPLVPIPISAKGLTGEKDPSRLKTGDLLLAQNMDFTVANLAQKESGAAHFNASAISGTPEIMAGIDWWPTASVQRMVIATSDGKLFKDDMTGAFATTLKTTLGSTKLTQFLECGAEIAGNNRKLFAINGNDPVQVLSGDGATTSNIATPPAEWTGSNQPTFGFLFRNSFVGGGNANEPHRVYASVPTNHEDLTSASSYTLSVYPGEGQRLVAGISAISRAFLWKYPQGIYWVNDAAETTAAWYIQPATREFGAAPTPHAIAPIDHGVVAFLSNNGNVVLMEETGGSLSGVQFTDLTRALNLRSFLRENFALSRLNRSQIRWYDDKHQLHILYAGLGATSENRRMIIDFNEEKTRVSISTKDTAEAIWMVLDSDKIPRPHTGDNVGRVWKQDQTARTVNGGSYTMTLNTAPTDFSDINPEYMAKKLFYRLHMEYEPSGLYSLPVEIYVDGRSIGIVTFDQSGAGAILPFTLSAVLGGNELRRRSRDIAGEGYYISFRIIDTSANNPRLARLWVEFELTTPAR